MDGSFTASHSDLHSLQSPINASLGIEGGGKCNSHEHTTDIPFDKAVDIEGVHVTAMKIQLTFLSTMQ